MISSKFISKAAAFIMLVAVAACIAAIVFANRIKESTGEEGVKMEYEDRLFDTSKIISVNIIMDKDKWDEMLENAISEQYYECDVEINGTRFYNVAIRPKGNTSLSNIVNDPDTDRYSFKLEFGHFTEGQTCWGVDKLILNNNYADATSMKEAIAYDMFNYLGADASLYNYADISLNGEYWGMYLALEAVEESFLMRNYGAADGDLYKPDPMSMNNMGDFDKNGFGGKAGMGGGRRGGDRKTEGTTGDGNFTPPDFGDMPEGFDFPQNGGDFTPPDFGNMPEGLEFSKDGADMPKDSKRPDRASNENTNENTNKDTSEKVSENTSEKTDKNESGFSPSDFGDMPEGFEFPGDGGDFTPHDFENMPEGFTFPEGGPGGFGGFGGGNGANLNYTDDDLDSYSSIWESSVRNSSKKDQRRVVKALKNISEGNDIEKYMDVDNLLRYMAVHSFLVNQDSLSGNMAHNYYLYESGGKLNIIPWDYNLSFGGMGMNRSGNGATSTINDAIDTPFAGTKFFDALLENEEYLEKYHEYYRQLVDEYVNGGVFDETYNRIVSQISDKVKDDPTAFYEYDEFEEAHKMLYDVVKLRAESVSGQLDGTIPSTDDGQKESDALIDASDIDLSVMGQMMGGGPKGDDESGEKRGMRPGGMAPRMSAAEEEKTVSFNWISLIICGAAVLAGLIFEGTFKRRKNNKHKQHKNHLTA